MLFSVEGCSNCIFLEFIYKLNKNEIIKFCISSGDIISNSRVNTQKCIKKLNKNKYVLAFIKTNKLLKSDIIKIIHIVDTKQRKTLKKI